MKTERFDRAMKALVKGYMNGTLAKGSCTACAVGNMVAEGIGKKAVIRDFDFSSFGDWTSVFCTSINGNQKIEGGNYHGEAKEEIDSTGYSWQELARVERAFEANTRINHNYYNNHSHEEIDEDQLNGLYAVVEVLCEIEGIKEVDQYKEMFVKA